MGRLYIYSHYCVSQRSLLSLVGVFTYAASCVASDIASALATSRVQGIGEKAVLFDGSIPSDLRLGLQKCLRFHVHCPCTTLQHVSQPPPRALLRLLCKTETCTGMRIMGISRGPKLMMWGSRWDGTNLCWMWRYLTFMVHLQQQKIVFKLLKDVFCDFIDTHCITFAVN